VYEHRRTPPLPRRRFVRRLLAHLGIAAGLAAAGALLWLLGTESGLRWALAFAPATVQLEGARGALIGTMSFDRVAFEGSEARNVALELDLLATHGTLHLVGYDDRDPIEADLMHRRERDILGDTPARLWRGLLHAEPPPTAGRRR